MDKLQKQVNSMLPCDCSVLVPIDVIVSLAAQQCTLANKMMAASWRFQSVCEEPEDLEKVLNEILKQLDC